MLTRQRITFEQNADLQNVWDVMDNNRLAGSLIYDPEISEYTFTLQATRECLIFPSEYTFHAVKIYLCNFLSR